MFQYLMTLLFCLTYVSYGRIKGHCYQSNLNKQMQSIDCFCLKIRILEFTLYP